MPPLIVRPSEPGPAPRRINSACPRNRSGMDRLEYDTGASTRRRLRRAGGSPIGKPAARARAESPGRPVSRGDRAVPCLHWLAGATFPGRLLFDSSHWYGHHTQLHHSSCSSLLQPRCRLRTGSRTALQRRCCVVVINFQHWRRYHRTGETEVRISQGVGKKMVKNGLVRRQAPSRT